MRSMKRLPLLAVLALLLALAAQPASAAISRNTIDPVATVGPHGRLARVSGPIACDAGEWLVIRITVDQASTGAWGRGLTILRCSGELQQWSVPVVAFSRASFAPGAAQACAFGVTTANGVVTDTRQWCAANGITLTPGG